MTTTLEIPPVAQRKSGPRPAAGGLNLVAIYEDFAAGIRMHEAVDWIAHVPAAGVPVSTEAWNFSMLERPDVCAAVLHQVAGIDLVIIAAAAGCDLPRHVRRLLDRCIAEGPECRPAALVGLHDDEFAAMFPPLPLCTDLGRIADKWRVEFINDGDLEDRVDRDFVEQLLWRPGRESSLTGAAASRLGGWGIDE